MKQKSLFHKLVITGAISAEVIESVLISSVLVSEILIFPRNPQSAWNTAFIKKIQIIIIIIFEKNGIKLRGA